MEKRNIGIINLASMHPSTELQGARSDLLKGKKIVLGITGSIAAVECIKLARELIRHGAEVHAVMTEKACEIIGPYAMEFATGNPVITRLTGKVEHVSLCGNVEGRADLLVIAPCTANTLGKMVAGIDDTPVTTFLTTAIGTGIPVMVVPAMHETMYDHPSVRENLVRAKALKVHIVDPVMEEKKAKMAPVAVLVENVLRALSGLRLSGEKVLVVAGATQESIDEMRIVTNRATGRTGIALAEEAFRNGAEVLLLAGENVSMVPQHIRCSRFSTTDDLMKKIGLLQNDREVPTMAFFVAGISDYAPEMMEGKIASGEGELVVRMYPTPKVIEKFRRSYPEAFLVGFKAESVGNAEELMKRAYKRLKEVGMDLIVANDLHDVKPDSNTVHIITPKKDAFKVSGEKKDIARFIIEKAIHFKKKGKE